MSGLALVAGSYPTCRIAGVELVHVYALFGMVIDGSRRPHKSLGLAPDIA
jgi:hypothetical protein